jgi:hypothetical protein
MTFTEETKIAFGKHIGTPLKDIPEQYFETLIMQEWFLNSKDSYYSALRDYINNRLKNKAK